jgi:hypothetical protein
MIEAKNPQKLGHFQGAGSWLLAVGGWERAIVPSIAIP